MPRKTAPRRASPTSRKKPKRERPDREPLRSRIFKAGAVCGLAGEAKAAPTGTVVTVGGDLCGSCVKKIEAKLGPMEEVAAVRCDTESKTVTIVPKPLAKVSPPRLWAALEQIGQTPERLVSPDGTFTARLGSD